MQYLVDEDLSTNIARIGRNRGLDIVSVHEIGRESWTDVEQLIQKAVEGRCIITGNRDEFIAFTVDFAAEGRPHAGVLIVQGALRDAGPAAIVNALIAFERARGSFSAEYVCDFLQPAEPED
jgi:predicted nuclease of predicted toxin-antitoxin system